MPKEKDNSSTSTLSGSHPPILLKQIVVWKPVNVASKIGVPPVGTTSSNGPFSIAVIVYRSAVAEKPPNMDLAKVIFLVRETFGKIATCQVPRAVSEQISQFHSSRRNFSILKQIYPLIPCEKGPFLKKGPKLIPQITLNECQPHGGTYYSYLQKSFCLSSNRFWYIAWTPKQLFLGGCLVISNHLPCKDLVHHSIETTKKKQKICIYIYLYGWPWGTYRLDIGGKFPACQAASTSTTTSTTATAVTAVADAASSATTTTSTSALESKSDAAAGEVRGKILFQSNFGGGCFMMFL